MRFEKVVTTWILWRLKEIASFKCCRQDTSHWKQIKWMTRNWKIVNMLARWQNRRTPGLKEKLISSLLNKNRGKRIWTLLRAALLISNRKSERCCRANLLRKLLRGNHRYTSRYSSKHRVIRCLIWSSLIISWEDTRKYTKTQRRSPVGIVINH